LLEELENLTALEVTDLTEQQNEEKNVRNTEII